MSSIKSPSKTTNSGKIMITSHSAGKRMEPIYSKQLSSNVMDFSEDGSNSTAAS